MKKRIFSIFTAFALLFSTLPVNALAVGNADAGGLCEHHPEHTAECGYAESAEGTPCNHEHTGDCYALVEKCVHEHGPECYPADSVSDNTATPSDAEDREPTECTHLCSEDTGCIKKELDCKHEHDDECGYVPATESTPCGFVCEECNAELGEQEKDGCICDTPCIEEIINMDCPVCGAEDADLTLCKGEPAQAQRITITGFDELPEEVAAQIVPAKTKLADLNLPVTLGASGYVGTRDSGGAESLTIEGVEWEPDPAYDENAAQGAWLFTAKLPEGYALLDGVELPQIGVMADSANLLADYTNVNYLDENKEEAICANAIEVVSPGGKNDITWTDGWYVVREDVSILQNQIIVSGDVKLILADNCKLTCQRGIYVPEDSSITIYAQSTDENTMGQLTITNKSSGAGIGGAMDAESLGLKKDAGSIYIHGGKIYAEATGMGAAGIGGGADGSCGVITITGGIITAKAQSGAGIGGGKYSSAGNITITGGTVTATGGGNSAGIGSGFQGKSGTIWIGGDADVTATGGSYGAGIGGGYLVGGGIITIEGGTVTAIGGGTPSSGGTAGIGAGDGDVSVDGEEISGGTITITGGTITAAGKGKRGSASSNWGAGIGSAGQSAYGGDITITGGVITVSAEGNNAYCIGPGHYMYKNQANVVISNNAVIYATKPWNKYHIYSNGNEENPNLDWNGVIFTGAPSASRPVPVSGTVYGTVTPTEDFEIAADMTLSIPNGSELYLENDVTMTNRGTITVGDPGDENGLLDYTDGMIHNYGTITGNRIVPGDQSWNDTESELSFLESSGNAQYGSSFDLTVEVKQKATNSLLRSMPKKTVYFYQGNTQIGSAVVDDASNQATLSITLEGAAWNTGEHTLRASYSGGNKQFLPSETTSDFTLTVEPREITEDMVELSGTDDLTYDGNPKTPAVAVMLNGSELKKGTDYEVEYQDNVNASTETTKAKAIITAKQNSNFSGNVTKEFTIAMFTPAAPSAPTLDECTDHSITLDTIDGAEYSMDGKSWQDSPVFTGLERNTEYTFHARIKGTVNTNASNPSSANFATTLTPLTDETVTVAVTGTYTYNGGPQIPDVVVKLADGTILVKDRDYTVSAKNNTNAGTGTVRVRGVGDFIGQVETTFTIQQATLTIDGATLAEKIYNGKTDATVTAVTFGGLQNNETLTLDEDHTATAEFADTNAGTGKTATITVALKQTAKANNYQLQSGSVSLPGFVIQKADQAALAIEGEPAGAVHYGDTFPLTASGGTGAGTVTWGVTGLATVDANGQVTVIGVGDITITATKDGGTNYENATAEYKFRAHPKALTVTSVTAADREYDGTKIVQLTGAEFEGLLDKDSGKVTVTGVGTVASPDVGEYTEIIVNNMELTGNDKNVVACYTLTEHNKPLPGTAKISQATVDPDTLPKDCHINIANHLAREYDYLLSLLCPQLNPDHVTTDRKDWGERSYEIVSVNLPAGYYANNARIDKAEGGEYQNRLYLPIRYNDVTTTGQVGTVTIRVNSKNYAPFENTIHIMAANKEAVTFEGFTTPDRPYNSSPYAYEGTITAKDANKNTVTPKLEITYTGRGGTGYSERPEPPTNAGEFSMIVRVADDDPKYIGRHSYNFTIKKAPGIGTVTMADFFEGEEPSVPVAESATNGTTGVQFHYKAQGADDNTYSPDKPTTAGRYTVRAIFPEELNHTAATATADFRVRVPGTYIITFDATGGAAPESQDTVDGKLTQLPESTKSGYTLKGWYTAASGGEKVTLDTVFSADTTVYAQWSSSGSGSGSDSSSGDDAEYDFWQEVREKIEDAKPGDVVKVNAHGYDKMPYSVMRALRENSGISLVIRWNGGEDIVIPAGKAQLPESLRIYYPLSLLAELYAEMELTNPETGGPIDLDKLNPATGGVWEVNAPVTAEPQAEEPQIIDPRRGLAETPELAEEGVEKAIPGVFQPEAPTETPISTGRKNGVWLAVLAIFATAAGGLVFWKRRQTAEK